MVNKKKYRLLKDSENKKKHTNKKKVDNINKIRWKNTNTAIQYLNCVCVGSYDCNEWITHEHWTILIVERAIEANNWNESRWKVNTTNS